MNPRYENAGMFAREESSLNESSICSDGDELLNRLFGTFVFSEGPRACGVLASRDVVREVTVLELPRPGGCCVGKIRGVDIARSTRTATSDASDISDQWMNGPDCTR